jgi:hypothetical protein
MRVAASISGIHPRFGRPQSRIFSAVPLVISEVLVNWHTIRRQGVRWAVSVCVYCGRRLPLLHRVLGGNRFCSKEHARQYQEELLSSALEQVRTLSEALPDHTPAQPEPVAVAPPEPDPPLYEGLYPVPVCAAVCLPGLGAAKPLPPVLAETSISSLDASLALPAVAPQLVEHPCPQGAAPANTSRFSPATGAPATYEPTLASALPEVDWEPTERRLARRVAMMKLPGPNTASSGSGAQLRQPEEVWGDPARSLPSLPSAPLHRFSGGLPALAPELASSAPPPCAAAPASGAPASTMLVPLSSMPSPGARKRSIVQPVPLAVAHYVELAISRLGWRASVRWEQLIAAAERVKPESPLELEPEASAPASTPAPLPAKLPAASTFSPVRPRTSAQTRYLFVPKITILPLRPGYAFGPLPSAEPSGSATRILAAG